MKFYFNLSLVEHAPIYLLIPFHKSGRFQYPGYQRFFFFLHEEQQATKARRSGDVKNLAHNDSFGSSRTQGTARKLQSAKHPKIFHLSRSLAQPNVDLLNCENQHHKGRLYVYTFGWHQYHFI